jgi:hypothetical protein
MWNSREQQLAFVLGIMRPMAISQYGMLMQVSKSVNKAASQWEQSLFERHHVAKLLSMACTTQKCKGRDTQATSYYVCTRTWTEILVTFCFKFYIPMRDCGNQNQKKRSHKDMLGDYFVYMRSLDNIRKQGIIRVELQGSYKTNGNIDCKL